MYRSICALLTNQHWWTNSFLSISKKRLKWCPSEDNYRTDARYITPDLKSVMAFKNYFSRSDVR